MRTRTALIWTLTWLVGVVSGEAPLADTGEGRGQAPLDHSLSVLEGPGGYIGVAVREIHRREARQRWFQRGVVVVEVAPEGPAGRAGLEPDDIVVQWDHIPVTDVQQFRRLVRETPPGPSLRVVVIRKGLSRTLAVTPDVRLRPAERSRA